MLTALNSVGAGYQVDVTANLQGTTAKAVFLVENNDNKGEYKVYDVTYTETTVANKAGNFTEAKLVGTVDFGESLNGLATADLTPHA